MGATHGFSPICYQNNSMLLNFHQQSNQRIGNRFRIANGVPMPECHTKRPFRYIDRQSDGPQHMGDFRGTRIAGRSPGDADFLQIKQMQQRLDVAIRKRHADMFGQPFPTVPIEHGLRNAVGDDGFECLRHFLQSLFRLPHVNYMVL